jgi:DNA-binding beta-propeller fold protein YncE
MAFLLLTLGLCLQAGVPPGRTPFLSGYAAGFLSGCAAGGAGRWDRMAVDRGAGRVYVPGAAGVLVLDLEGRRLGQVAGVRGAHSVALAPELGIGICSSGRSNSLLVFNLVSLEVEKELRTTGGDPQAVLFDPAARRIFAFNQRGRNATVFDAFGGAVAGSIPLGGRPGTAVADGRGHVLVSVKDTREVLVLDSWKLAVLKRVPLPAMEDPTGLALDPVRNRLFVVGANRLMGILDSDGWKLLKTLPIGAEPESAVCDPATGGAYVSHRDGSITVINADAAGEYRVRADHPANGNGSGAVQG